VTKEHFYTIRLTHSGLSQLQTSVIRNRYSDQKLQALSNTAGPLSVTHANVSFPIRAENPEHARILSARMSDRFSLDAKRVGRGDWPFTGITILQNEQPVLTENWLE
jgi:hypothetical protein